MTTEPRTVLEGIIRQQRLTPEEVCEHFAQVATEMSLSATLSPRHLRRLAAGERPGARGRVHSQRVFESMFGHPIEALLAPWPPMSPDDGEFHSSRLNAAKSAKPATATDHTDQQSCHEELCEMTLRRARQFTLDTTEQVASEVIDQLQDDLRQTATAYPSSPPRDLLPDLAEVQDTVFTLLDRRHRVADSAQLYVLAGVTSGLLAKVAHDLGDPRGALAHTRTALLCADHADHDALRGWIRGLQSFISYWAGRPHDAIRFATGGREPAERSGGTSQVFLAANEARAWASLGNAAQTLDAIRRSEEAADNAGLDEVDFFGGICTFQRSRQLYYTADALVLLPNHAAGAVDYSRQALDAYSDPSAPDWSFSDQAGSSVDLAVAQVTDDAPDGAAETLEPVLSLEPGRRIHGIVSSLSRVQHALAAGAASNVTSDLQEQIEAFTRVPAAAAAGLPR